MRTDTGRPDAMTILNAPRPSVRTVRVPLVISASITGLPLVASTTVPLYTASASGRTARARGAANTAVATNITVTAAIDLIPVISTDVNINSLRATPDGGSRTSPCRDIRPT